MNPIIRTALLSLSLGAVACGGATQVPVSPLKVTVTKDVQYGEAGGQKLLLDVYQPDGGAKTKPAIVWVHGGGWSAGNRASNGPMCQIFAADGYVCFTVSYRLVTTTTNKWPAQIDDVQLAVRWIRENAAKYGVDSRRIGAIGFSAGGHLVAMMGARETRDKSLAYPKHSSKVNCVVDVFGPTDFTASSAGVSPVGLGIVTNFIGKKPEEAPEAYKDASPVTFLDKNTAPFLILHGTLDPLVPFKQSQIIYDALKKLKIEATLIPMEGEGHGFAKPESRDKLLAESKAFFKKHLTP